MGANPTSLFLALGAALPALAAGDVPPAKAEASATVTVTAEATPVELTRTPNPVLVLDKAAIDAQGAENLGDLLQKLLPGQIYATGGAGAVSSIILGGGRPQDTVVTLDGIRLADATGLGGANLSVISLAGIERIEVQQGPCSTRFGSDAQAGVVALYSAGFAAKGLTGQVRAGIGSQGIRQAGFAPAYGWDGGWVRASLSAQREDGATPADNPYRSTGAFVSAGQQLGKDTLASVSYLNSFAGVPLPIAYADYGTTPRYDSQYLPFRQDFSRSEVLSGSLRSSLTPNLLAELTLGQALQTRLEPNYGDNRATEAYLSRRNQAQGRLSWRRNDHETLTAGFDASEETARFAGTPDEARGRHLALILEDQAELAANLRLVVSVRGEKDRLSFPSTADTEANRITWKAGVNLQVTPELRVFASEGTAFSNPLLFQTIYNAQYGGSKLANEHSATHQVGIVWQRQAWRFSADLAETDYRDLVYFDDAGGQWVETSWGGYWTGIYRNGSRLHLESVNLRLGYEASRWGAEGFYRNQAFRDLDAPEGREFSTAAVIRKPFQTLGLSGHAQAGPVRLEVRWSWTGSRYDYGLPGAFHQHFNDLAVAAAWSLRKDLVVALRGEHLMQPRTSREQWLARARDFENDASQVFGYPAQPPTVSLEVRYRF